MPNTLLFIVTTDIIVMVAESTRVAQEESPMESLGAGDSAIQILTVGPVPWSLLSPLLP